MSWGRSRRQTKADRLKAERDYLRERMACVYIDQPLTGRQRKPRQACRWCGRAPATDYWATRQPCRKRRKPNRWRLHFNREQGRRLITEEERRERAQPLDVRLMRELGKLEHEAKWLRIGWQDDRAWAFHPVARRYRRIVKRLWTMPISTAAAAASPSRRRLLTRKRDLPLYG